MTIAEVSKYFDIKPDTLRYYEKIGLMDPVERTKNGQRIYREKDIKHLEFIRCMRKAGLSIETLVEYIRLLKLGDSSLIQRRELLLRERDILAKRMENDQQAIEKLNNKIAKYNQLIQEKEN